MSPLKSRIRIENEILGRLEKKYSEEEQANHLMNLLIETFQLQSACILAVEPAGTLSVFAHRGLSGEFIKEMYAGPTVPVVQAGLSGEVLVAGNDPRAKDPSFRLEHEYGSLFAFPCRLQEQTLGVFIADSSRPDVFTPELAESFRSYAQLGTLFLAMRNLRARISRVPDIDAVTGLHTFKYFHEVLHREITRGRKFRHPVSLAFFKIRGLREMNGVWGHVAADKALAEVAARVKAAFREVDYLARAGGTIYAVMPHIEKADAAKVAERIVEAMETRPIGVGDIFLKLAVGIAAGPKDGETERDLIPHVESAVHDSMRKAGNAVSVYRD